MATLFQTNFEPPFQDPPDFQKPLKNTFQVAYNMKFLLYKHSLKFQTIQKIFDPAAGHVKIIIHF